LPPDGTGRGHRIFDLQSGQTARRDEDDMGLMDTIKGWFSKAKESEALDKAGDVAEKAWDKTKDVAETAWDKTKDVAEDVKDKVDDMRHGDEGGGEGQAPKPE
jgi:hypothetical protein